MHIAPEHELEPEHGLPQPLPPGERIVWQGAPDWKALAVRAFHLRTLAIYFTAILLLTAAIAATDGRGVADGVVTMLMLAPLAALALAILGVLAWLTARTTVYTVTDKRVVMRIGIVLSTTFNLPYSRIDAAAVGATAGDKADIALALEGPDRIGYANLWPHARPWYVRQPQPMLRCLPEGRRVAELLAHAWSEARGIAVAADQPAVGVPAAAGQRPVPAAAPRSLGFPHAARGA